MKSTSLYLMALITAALLVPAGCDKDDDIVIPPSVVHFTNQRSGTFFVTGPGATYSIPVGLTNVASEDRTINVTVTSPTGAQQGNQYTASSTVVIPAGKSVGAIEVAGVFDEYAGGREDTLVFTLSGENVAAADYNSSFTLLVRGPCNESDVDLNTLLGDYNNTNENGPAGGYGPYTTQVVAVSQDPGATTGTITVRNIYDAGWEDIVFILDWTDPANRTVTLDTQEGVADGATLASAYAGVPVVVTAIPDEPGTFSVCNQTITLKFYICLSGLGCFGDPYTAVLAR